MILAKAYRNHISLSCYFIIMFPLLPFSELLKDVISVPQPRKCELMYTKDKRGLWFTNCLSSVAREGMMSVSP